MYLLTLNERKQDIGWRTMYFISTLNSFLFYNKNLVRNSGNLLQSRNNMIREQQIDFLTKFVSTFQNLNNGIQE